MTEREQIIALRGKEISKTICSVETKAGVLSLMAYGYENYPEPQWYFVALDGLWLRNEKLLLSDYWEDAAMEKVKTHYPEYNIEKLELAVGQMEKFPW